MKYDPEKHHRRSVRLRGYDYTQAGAYYVTICTWGREGLFGDVIDGTMCLSTFGRIAQAVWEELPQHYPGLELDEFVVMPNHVHGIIVLAGNGGRGGYVVGAGFKPAPTRAVHANSAPTRAVHANSAPTRAVHANSAPTGSIPGQPASLQPVHAEPAPTPTSHQYHGLSEAVRAFKTFSARRINASRGTQGASVWQRSFYDRIIRNERELNAVRQYIANNPVQWEVDRENPNRRV